MVLGPLISAGASLIGGLLGKSEAEEQADMQKDFAQKGIQWKVKDSLKAGIHPLFGLGAQTHSFSPVQTGSLPNAIANMGTDLSRAIDSTRPASTTLDAFTKTLQTLQLERAGLENQLLASQIAKINQAGVHPPMPTAGDTYVVPGQAQSGLTHQTSTGSIPGDTGQVKLVPQEVQATIQHGTQEAAPISDTGWIMTDYGPAPVRSRDAADRTEDDFFAAMAWNMRNRVIPTVNPTSSQGPTHLKLPRGMMWVYNPLTGAYQPEPVKHYRR